MGKIRVLWTLFVSMIIQELPNSEKPREKALLLGVSSLSNRELLSLIIRHGCAGESALDVAEKLIVLADGLANLPKLTMIDYQKVKGISKVKAIEIASVFELAKRCNRLASMERTQIINPTDLVDWFEREIGNEMQEHFIVVCLNVKNHILGYQNMYKGGIDRAYIHPREIFKYAYSLSASKLILIHNHPSGDIAASNEDIRVTKELIKAAEFMQLEILDHLIVANNNYLSFKEQHIF